MWLDGRSFLSNTAEWPTQSVLVTDIMEDDPEVKKNSKRCCSQQVEVETDLSKLFARYSSLNKLQRAVAWILRFKIYLKMKYGNKLSMTL